MNTVKLNYHKDIKDEIKNIKENIILIFNKENFEVLKEVSKIISKKNRSVVFVYDKINENLHNEINISLVPTLKEAEDFIEMEKIEREILN